MSKRQINSTFTKQELKFIILEFGQNPSPTVVKRKFCQRFAIKGRNRLKYRLTHFTRVYTNFLKSPKKKVVGFFPLNMSIRLEFTLKKTKDQFEMRAGN